LFRLEDESFGYIIKAKDVNIEIKPPNLIDRISYFSDLENIQMTYEKIVLKDRNIYVYITGTVLKVEYQNLVNFKKDFYTKYNLEGYLVGSIPFLVIEYIENGKIKKRKFYYSKEDEAKVSEAISSFITNKQINKIVNLSNEFFDIRNEELTEFIDKNKKIEMNKYYVKENRKSKIWFIISLLSVFSLLVFFVFLLKLHFKI